MAQNDRNPDRSGWRTIHQLPGFPGARVDLAKCDVTDPTIHARAPYALTRTGFSGQRIILCELSRDQLQDLGRAIDRELHAPTT